MKKSKRRRTMKSVELRREIKAAKRALDRNKRLIDATYRGTPKGSWYTK